MITTRCLATLLSTLATVALGCSDGADPHASTSGAPTGQGGAGAGTTTSTGGGASSGAGATGGASTGGSGSTGSGRPPEPPSVFVAPDGDDANPCTEDSPCLTMARGYDVAQDGDTVLVRAGGYEPQRVGENGGGTKAVTFWGEPGAKMKQLQNWADNVTFDGLEIDAQLEQLSGMQNHGASGVTFKNGTIGNVADEKGALISGENFTFDNVLFHDAVYLTDGVHMECVYAIVVPGMKILNSTFRDCAVMDLFFTYGDWWDPLPPAYGNITIENNVFAHPEMEQNGGWHYYSLYVGNLGPPGSNHPMDGWVVRNNTFENNATFQHDVVSSRWVNNIGAWDCQPGMTYSHNVGEACGPTDKEVSPASSGEDVTAAFGWKDPASYDFRLTAGSPAIDAGDPSDFPPTDRDGKARTGTPEAGAYEY